MSLVAKAFVVLNLVVSVVFLVFAMNVWTANTKWQKMYFKEKMASVEGLAAVQRHQVDVEKQLVAEQGINEGQKTSIYRLKMDANKYRDDALELQSKFAALQNSKEIQEAKNEELGREYNRVKDEIIKLQGVVRKQQIAVMVERDNAVKARNEKSEMENDLNVTKQTLAALERDKRSIEEQLALQTSRIERLMVDHNVPVPEILNERVEATQPAIADAQVLAVRPDVGLVMISCGSQQGVKPGYRFTVSRGDQYVGKVQIEKVYPDMCSARILAPLTKGDIQVHDEARSR